MSESPADFRGARPVAMYYMESEGGVAPRLLRDVRAGVASGRFLKAEPRLARATVSGAVLATLQMSLTHPARR